MSELRPTPQPTPQPSQPPTPQLARTPTIGTVRMFTGWTIFFMVILRIFIGWHFFIEGVYKICLPDWRATSYLVASAGPAREMFRSLVKDVDGRQALALDEPGILKGTEFTGEKAQALKSELTKRLQARLDAMFNDTVKFYRLDPNQTNLAKNLLSLQQLKLAQILEDRNLAAQVWDYKILLDEIAAQEQIAETAFERQRLQDMYVRKARAKADLLDKVEKPIRDLPGAIYKAPGLLTRAQLEKGYIRVDVSPTRWIDIANILGLTIVGVCLILGLFTRLACLGAAGLLAMYYMAMPPLPGLPEGPTEGHYLIINKNLIELVTVLMLATTRIGRWGGLDAIIARRAKPAV